MLKINLRSHARGDKNDVAFGYGRTFNSFVKYLSRREDVQLVENYLDADIQVCMCFPYRRTDDFHWWGRKRHRVQVIYSTWETTVIPEHWAEVMNTCNAVFAMSQWCADVFKSNGVEVPVYWCQLAADGEDFPYFDRDWSGTESSLWPGKKFVYLWQGMHPADRKGMMLAQRAFAELNLKDAWLVAKWYPVVSTPFGPVVYENRNLTQLGQILSRKSYMELMARCHVSVNPFRGESPGQMPMETASTGMYTIATNWSGATDYLRPEYFWPLKYQLSEPGQDYISTSPYNDIRYATPGKAQDALVDIEDLKQAMLLAYQYRDEAAKIGKASSEYIQREWNWEIASARLVQACKKVLENV